jgi:hypothetical protein
MSTAPDTSRRCAEGCDVWGRTRSTRHKCSSSTNKVAPHPLGARSTCVLYVLTSTIESSSRTLQTFPFAVCFASPARTGARTGARNPPPSPPQLARLLTALTATTLVPTPPPGFLESGLLGAMTGQPQHLALAHLPLHPHHNNLR